MTMTRDEIERHVAMLMADSVKAMRADLESLLARLIAAKPVPPFVPPPPWTAGRHGAGNVVRHRNGLFVARHDTETEPGGDAWLPLLVGLAGFEIEWTDDRTLEIRCELSDGTGIVRRHEFAVPLVRGEWQADDVYRAGDRVMIRGVGEYHAREPNTGVRPGADTPESKAAWLKVNRYHQSAFGLVLNREGMFTNQLGIEVGSIKPMVADLLAGLIREHAGSAGDGGSHDGR